MYSAYVYKAVMSVRHLTKMVPKVAIILLNWNRFDDTAECAESIQQITYGNFELIIVDNGSSDNSLERLRTCYSHASSILETGCNLGFVGGNNFGIEYALDIGAEYILLLNNDTTVSKDFLMPLVDTVESDPTIGIVGPKIYYYDRPREIWFAGSTFRTFFGQSIHLGHGRLDDGTFDFVTDTAFITGCAMMIKASVVREVGLLDFDYYHSCEDLDFCFRARAAGYRIIYVPQAKIWHKVAQSSGGLESPFSLYYQTRNRLIIMSKHGRWFHWPTFLFHFFFSYVLQRFILFAVQGKGRECYRAIIYGVWDFVNKRYGRRV